MSLTKPVVLGAAAILGLSACNTNPDYDKTQRGAVIGAATGAAASIVTGGDADKTLAAAIAGGVVGAVVGNIIDKQEKELRNDLAGSGAVITRSGDRLIVTLPEAITFDTDSTFVRPNLQDDLRTLAAHLNRYPDSTVDVVGHTDNVGDAGYNQDLSARRAAAVTSILTRSGVTPSRIRSYGRGELAPIASNDTAAGRQANRRVEIIINPT